MDLVDILGGLLKRKMQGSGGGGGGDILKDILGGGSRRPEPPMSETGQAESGRSSRSGGLGDISAQARELEDLLNVAKNRHAQRPAPPTDAPRREAPSPRRQSAPIDEHRGTPSLEAPYDSDTGQQQQALVLVRAMVNAAKSDGQLSPDEQQAILQQVGDTSPETIQFLREEFSRPLDVREFAWSVPLGLEQQVYSMSLMSIRLDSDREAGYLRDLAHGLRLRPEVWEQIHQRLGAPSLG